MNRLFSALGVVLALGMAVPASVQADQGEGQDKPPFEKLNLTEGQKTQMKALREQQRASMGTKRKDMMQAHRDLRAQIFSDNPDAAQIEALKAKIAGLQKDQLAARIEMDRKVAAILTPEQRKTMAAMPPPGPGRRHHRHHHGKHEGPGPDGPPEDDQ